jgi:hypothetical protein
MLLYHIDLQYKLLSSVSTLFYFCRIYKYLELLLIPNFYFLYLI